MLNETAEEMIKSGMVTFGLLQELLNNGESHETSTSCSLFSKARVKRMILTGIHGKRGVIEPESAYADFAIWTLVEFG
jgi:hypothetical protein